LVGAPFDSSLLKPALSKHLGLASCNLASSSPKSVCALHPLFCPPFASLHFDAQRFNFFIFFRFLCVQCNFV
jgi:hypothetical protein